MKAPFYDTGIIEIIHVFCQIYAFKPFRHSNIPNPSVTIILAKGKPRTPELSLSILTLM